jgi:hypothetical protein
MMKKYILTCLIALLTVASTYAQQQTEKKPLGDDKQFYVLVQKDTAPVFSQCIIYNKKRIDSVKVFNSAETKQNFGSDLSAQYGAIVIYANKNATYLNRGEIFKLHNISSEFLKLPLYIDSAKFSRPETILVDKEEIEQVRIATRIYKGKNEKFVHISTKLGTKIWADRAKSTFKPKRVINNLPTNNQKQ